MSVVHGTVTEHGGNVVVNSIPDGGTEFVIRLPAFRSREHLLAVSSLPQPPRGRGELVLLAHGDEYMRQILTDSLESVGYNVIATADAADTIVAAQTHQADIKLVVLDMDLPNRADQSCLDQLRQVSQDTPVVLLAGHADDYAESLAADGDHVLESPFHVSELLEVIGAALQPPTRKGT